MPKESPNSRIGIGMQSQDDINGDVQWDSVYYDSDVGHNYYADYTLLPDYTINKQKYERGPEDMLHLKIMSHNVWNGDPGGRDKRYGDFYRKYSPDVLCLQEMAPIIRTGPMLKGLLKDYEFVDVDTDGRTNFTPILIKKGHFLVIEAGFHSYSGYNDAGSKSVTWAVLEKIDSHERFGVASTHFWWQERGKEDDDCRINNAIEMRAFVEYMRVKYNIPVFAMGDLNCNKQSNPYKEIVNGGGEDVMNCATVSSSKSNTWHDYPVKDANGIYGNGSKPKGDYRSAIDHIFVYNKKDKADILVYDVITEQDALDQSDHCPIFVDCIIRPQN